MEQRILFSKNTIKNINIYQEAAKTESVGGSSTGKNTSINVQFTPTQKVALKAIIDEHNLKASTFIREMVDTYIDLFPFQRKIKRHKTVIADLLKSLS